MKRHPQKEDKNYRVSCSEDPKGMLIKAGCPAFAAEEYVAIFEDERGTRDISIGNQTMEVKVKSLNDDEIFLEVTGYYIPQYLVKGTCK